MSCTGSNYFLLRSSRSTTMTFLTRVLRPPSGGAVFFRVALRNFSPPRLLAGQPDPLARYAEQLQKKAQELGLASVDELKQTHSAEIAEKKAKMNLIDPLAELAAYERKQAQELKLRQASLEVRGAIDASAPKAPYKTLASYLDVEKVRVLPQREVLCIWRARFANQERSLHAMIGAEQFAAIFANAFKNPSFVLPLPKDGDAYEMHFVQWAFVGPHTTHCMLTSLAEYKLHKEYSKPHTTLMFHLELLEDVGVVLMNGRVEDDLPLSMDEAQLLLFNVQRFYGGMPNPKGSKKKLEMLRAFTLGDAGFDMEKLIEEAARMD